MRELRNNEIADRETKTYGLKKSRETELREVFIEKGF